MRRNGKRLHDAAGLWVELDHRHTIAREFCGQARAQWVFRYCGEWISCHPTKREAVDKALRWEMARVARLC